MLSDPTFYVLIAFVLFFMGAGKPLYKAITGALDGQIQKIETDLDEATCGREEAQVFLNETKLKLHQATKISQEILAQARELVESMENQAQVALKETLVKRRQLANNRVNILVAQAEQELRGLLADEVLASVKTSLKRQKPDINIDESIAVISTHSN